jgi:predicted peroxiredoxin
LTKAEAEAVKAKKELDDFMATAKRAGVPAIWIK